VFDSLKLVFFPTIPQSYRAIKHQLAINSIATIQAKIAGALKLITVFQTCTSQVDTLFKVKIKKLKISYSTIAGIA
jgi:hypothetical protein